MNNNNNNDGQQNDNNHGSGADRDRCLITRRELNVTKRRMQEAKRASETFQIVSLVHFETLSK